MTRILVLTVGLAITAAAIPQASSPAAIVNPSQLSSAISGLKGATGTAYFASYSAIYSAVRPSPAPTNAADAASRVSAAYSAYPSNPNALGARLLLNGVAGSSLQPTGVPGYPACTVVNNNAREPAQPVYPQKSSQDAPYDVSEAQLRSAIFIPPGFTYGQKKPVLFIPGTGINACENFQANYGKTLANVPYADPIYVNVPNNMLDDIQTNAEYVAYAINYISGISNNQNVSLLTWSQGSIASQWALKYWPSTVNVTSDVFTISADYDGTVLAPLICPGTGTSPGAPCPPAIYQQFSTARFIRTLRSRNGDSAYVPGTSFWTIYDEIVEPQQNPYASAMLNDTRGRGVLNAQDQGVCSPTDVAALPNFGHEACLYNSPGFYLAKDQLSNGGPAQLARSTAQTHCNEFEAPGLTLADVFATEAIIPIAGNNIFQYSPKVTQEPPIKSYAAADAPAN